MGAYRILPWSGFVADASRLQRKFPRIAEDIAGFIEKELSVDPKHCARPIPGTGGARKARCGIPSAHISKSDGLRLICIVSDQHRSVVLLMLYYKKEQPNVAAMELRKAVDKVQPMLEEAAIKRAIDPAQIREQLKEILARYG